jgi:peroxiredoxin
MALSIGVNAPDFTLPTKTAAGPELVTLSKFFGMGNVLLLFFPMAFTDTCTQEMCGVSREFRRYVDLGAMVLGISGDNPFAQEAWAKKENIVFPLLSDYEHEVARRYEVAYDAFLPQINLPMGGVAKRAAFIVDKAGVIQYVECLEDARQLPNFTEIVKRLETLD